MRFKVRSNYRTHILSASHDIHKSKMCENCLLLSLCIRTLSKRFISIFPILIIIQCIVIIPILQMGIPRLKEIN